MAKLAADHIKLIDDLVLAASDAAATARTLIAVTEAGVARPIIAQCETDIHRLREAFAEVKDTIGRDAACAKAKGGAA